VKETEKWLNNIKSRKSYGNIENELLRKYAEKGKTKEIIVSIMKEENVE
jgi:hypothetical protein